MPTRSSRRTKKFQGNDLSDEDNDDDDDDDDDNDDENSAKSNDDSFASSNVSSDDGKRNNDDSGDSYKPSRKMNGNANYLYHNRRSKKKVCSYC